MRELEEVVSVSWLSTYGNSGRYARRVFSAVSCGLRRFSACDPQQVGRFPTTRFGLMSRYLLAGAVRLKTAKPASQERAL